MSTPLTARIVEEHANAVAALAPAGPTAARRRTALAALSAGGLPTSRDENWKYANLRPLERLRFVPAAPARPVAATDLPAAIPGFTRYVFVDGAFAPARSEEHTSELQSRPHLVCRLLLEKKKTARKIPVNF